MDVFPTELRREEKKKGSVCPSVFFPASFNIRSLAVSLGSKLIDLNLYRKEIKSCWEITFCGVKGFETRVSQLAFCLQINL